MGRTLKLAEKALALGNAYLGQGREQEALAVLEKLARFRKLPLRVAEDAHAEVAAIHLRRHKFALARRQMQVALARQPDCAHFHYLLASAHDQDADGDPQRAARHYARAVALDPEQPEYRSDYGAFLIAMGDNAEGIEHLEKAAALAPDDADCVRRLAMNLLESGRPEDARRLAMHALFRNPDVEAFQKLWRDLRFDEVRREQEQHQVPHTLRLHSGPVLLPFKRPRREATRTRRMANGQILRLDPPSNPTPHMQKPAKKRQTR